MISSLPGHLHNFIPSCDDAHNNVRLKWTSKSDSAEFSKELTVESVPVPHCGEEF